MKAKRKPLHPDKMFFVETGEIKEGKNCMAYPVARSFETYKEAKQFAESIGVREITEANKMNNRGTDYMIVKRHFLPMTKFPESTP